MDTCRCAGICVVRQSTGIGKLLLIVAAVLVWSCLAAAPAQAQATAPPDTACKLCHVDNEGEITLPSGETIQLGIDLTVAAVGVGAWRACCRVSLLHGLPCEPRSLPLPAPAQSGRRPGGVRGGYRAELREHHTTIEAHNPGHLMAKDNPNCPAVRTATGGTTWVAPVASMAADPVGTCQGCHQTYADPVVQETHEQIVAHFTGEQTCQTCHSDVALTEDALCKTCHLTCSTEKLCCRRARRSPCT